MKAERWKRDLEMYHWHKRCRDEAMGIANKWHLRPDSSKWWTGRVKYHQERMDTLQARWPNFPME